MPSARWVSQRCLAPTGKLRSVPRHLPHVTSIAVPLICHILNTCLALRHALPHSLLALYSPILVCLLLTIRHTKLFFFSFVSAQLTTCNLHPMCLFVFFERFQRCPPIHLNVFSPAHPSPLTFTLSPDTCDRCTPPGML